MAAESLDNLEAPERSLDRIDRLVGEALQLSRTESPPAEFFAGLTERLTTASTAVAAAVWLRQDGRIQLARQNGALAVDGEIGSARKRLVERTLNSGAPTVVSPQSPGAETNGVSNNTGCLLLLSPFRSAGTVVGVLELAQRAELPAPAREGCVQLLAEFSDIAGDYSTAEELRAMRRRADLWARYERFAQRIHVSLNLRETAYAVVNEARPLVGCDRVSLLVRSGGGCRTWAVSGVDAVHRRSAVARGGERLAAAVLRTDEPLWYAETSAELPPQIDEPLQAYLEASPARALAVLPLFAVEAEGAANESPPFAALLIENFDATWDADLPRRALAVASQSTTAVQNALEHRATTRLPIVGGMFARPWRRAPSRARWWLGAGLLLALVVAALCLVPADFDVPGRGRLLPQERRNVHAPAEGIVRIAGLPVAERDDVGGGDVVARIRSPELDREYGRVFGELQTVRKQLDAVRTARLRDDLRDDRNDERNRNLAARERELLQRRDNLQQDLTLLKQRGDELQVRSPIAGRVLTWDVIRRLDGRPVRRGDVLMRVARLDGPWELELDFPEREAGRLREAQQRSRSALPVSFQLSNEPGTVHRGTIRSIAAATDFSQDGPSFVRVVVAVDNPENVSLRPGATVSARVHCGRRAVGYVWFHDLIDAVRSRLW